MSYWLQISIIIKLLKSKYVIILAEKHQRYSYHNL